MILWLFVVVCAGNQIIFNESPFANLELEGRKFQEWRTIDGTNNNQLYPKFGKAGGPIVRFRNLYGYADYYSELAGELRYSARNISNIIGYTDYNYYEAAKESDVGLTNMAWQWGQFLDHDIVLTEETAEEDLGQEGEGSPLCIKIPKSDPAFKSECINFKRSVVFEEPCNEEECPPKPRRQKNSITSYIDASNVYGSDLLRNQYIREEDSPYLATSIYNGEVMAPQNKNKLQNAGGDEREDLLLYGDVRGNEQIGLAAMHTLFIREHNRLVDLIKQDNPELSDDDIYEYARAIVGAEMQQITYNEFLPAFFGDNYYQYIGSYEGYNSKCDASINSIFSTAAFRVGHTLVSEFIPRRFSYCEEECEVAPNINLIDSYFNPIYLKHNKIDEILAGLSCTPAKNIDTFFVKELRDFLFFGVNGDENPLDLLALNIKRGRDHGLMDYNNVRKAFGLRKIDSWWDNIFDNMETRLKKAYENVGIYDMDLFTAALAEKHLPGSAFGETLAIIWAEQFRRLRNCDRFYFENYLGDNLVNYVKGLTLKDIIEFNTDLEGLPYYVMQQDQTGLSGDASSS